MSANICYISLDNINRVPYLFTYLQILPFESDLVYWDRSGLLEELTNSNIQLIPFISGSKPSNKFKKLLGYLGFHKFMNRILEENKYKLIIFLTSNAGILSKRQLLLRNKGRYIVDVRDYWMEKNPIIYYLEKFLIKNSGLALISSPAYTKFLPPHEYFVFQNYKRQELGMDNVIGKRIINKTYTLSCIGSMKNRNIDEQMIHLFANDERFILKYIGRGFDQLFPLIEDLNAKNIFLEGEFPIEKTMEKYDGTDAILNLYGNHDPHFDYALSNKLYLAAELVVPIIVCKDTYMEEIAKKYNLGTDFDYSSGDIEKKKLYDYLTDIDYKKFRLHCKRFLDLVVYENNRTEAKIIEFSKNIINNGHN